MLTLGGNRFNIKLFGFRKLGQISNWIIRLSVTISTVIMIVFVSFVTISLRQVDAFTLSTMTTVTLGQGAMVLFAVKRSRIKRLLRIVSNDEVTLRKLRRDSLFALLYILFYAMYLFISGYLNMEGIEIVTSIFPILLMYLPLIINQYSIIYPLLYLVTFELLAAHELSHLQQFRLLIISNTNVMRIILLRRTINNLKAEFECLLNIVPSILLGIMFVTIPCGILIIKSDNSAKLSQWIDHVLFHIPALFLIYQMVQTITRCKEKITGTISELILLLQEKIAKGERSHRNQLLIDELKYNQDFEFTGWFLFRIDRKIILSFVSSIITFSVLVIQLLDSRPILANMQSNASHTSQ